ncbi:MAG: leucine--tRNA ligase [candidate division WOR-3 bacterium]|nr:MAG: leucine--tRNA ligase [candidate division WOR-3 bacterium]
MSERKTEDPKRARLAYDAGAVERRWQEYWSEHRVFATSPEPERKYYVLEMFIYPSGDLHMGHARNYTIGDVIGRYRKMQGYDVLHPFGWDAFGLPAENSAIAHGNHPRDWTFKSIGLCKHNLDLMGIAYDWDREINTCVPEYYRWDQWLFLQFHKRGLAYRKEALLNWCPNCQTVLANEQVVDGHCYRSTCRAAIEKRKMTQWFFRITDYAEELLQDIERLDGWPDSVRTMQRNWIGRSEGVEVDFALADASEGGTDGSVSQDANPRVLPVFTTRPDTLWGVTFMALAPDALLAEELLDGSEREPEGREFIRRVLLKSEFDRVAEGLEKEGFFTGRYAVNPVNGEQVPIYIADFVLASYGTGMIMAVPGHDQRDFEFARKYDIPIKVVIQPPGAGHDPIPAKESGSAAGGCRFSGSSCPKPPLDPSTMTAAYTEDGVMTGSGPFDGTVAGKGEQGASGIEKVTDWLEQQGMGRRKVNYRLKDWLISRQRYWGAPIPMVHCDRCGIVPVPEDQLPVVLPADVTDFKPRGTSVLASVKEFYETSCPKCGGPAFRDPDTMDTFVNSSWYMVRYADPHNDRLPFSKAAADAWLPIDEYIGGIEHATGHLIFFRFFTKVMADIGLLSFREPCQVLHTHGMVAHNGVTMSSSKNVGVWVGPFTAEYGADAARLAVLFAAPPDKGMDWTDDLVTGVTRFLNRVWRIFEEHGERVTFDPPDTGRLAGAERDLYIRLNQMLHKVIADTEGFQYNTAIAAQMEFLNDLYGFEPTDSPVFGFCLGRLVFCLAPFAPHLAEELWHRARPDAGSLFDERFPQVDADFLLFETMTIPVQVNGKLRARLEVPRTATEDEIRNLALADPAVSSQAAGSKVCKVIYVKGRLVNVVIARQRR